MIELVYGATRATIEPEGGFSCTSLIVNGWSVLSAAGVRIGFPWVGARPARAACLRLGRTKVDLGGGPAGGLAATEWSFDQAAPASACARLWTKASATAYPFELMLSGTWTLDAEGLRLELEIANRSRKAYAPFGLGVRAELASVGEVVEVLAPAEEFWPLDARGALVGTPPEPVDRLRDFRRPTVLGEPIQTVLTRRHFANLRTQLAVLAPRTGREVWLNTSADFREAELALEPDGSGFVESATSTPDAFALQAAGLATGLRALAPGEVWRGSAQLVCRPAIDARNVAV